ncbi:MAG: hypothetical protein KC933_28385 [Myxococcales bacterium]|nr:hypothetical protein [Myxococcales bacterium]MCB9648082.1 hypothetical protein [Deltaproteobacteria bacterium]
MSLGWKAVVVAALAVLVIVLNLRARRHGHERMRTEHTRRKIRVPLSQVDEPKERR